jgi:hypothetical protein
MIKVEIWADITFIVADSRGTWDFAHTNPEGKWPCSILSGNDIDIMLSREGDLIDTSIPEDVSSEELTAFIHYAFAEIDRRKPND